MDTTLIHLPAFGAYLPSHGGHFAAIMRGPVIDGIEQPPYALIASPKELGEFEGIEWGKYGHTVPGCSSRTDGEANTTAMLAANCPAASKVRELTIEGHSDWHLPSLGELNSAAANAPELFDAEGDYWTSTQTSANYAFVVDFEYGGSGWGNKVLERRVRAFRRVQLDHLNT